MSPNRPAFQIFRAEVLEERFDYETAISEYSDLIKIEPQNEARFLKARARLKTKAGDEIGATSD